MKSNVLDQCPGVPSLGFCSWVFTADLSNRSKVFYMVEKEAFVI